MLFRSAAINHFLIRQQERFPHIDLLRATNPEGEAIWGKGVDPAQRASLAQRDYYKRLRDDPALGMVIAERNLFDIPALLGLYREKAC